MTALKKSKTRAARIKEAEEVSKGLHAKYSDESKEELARKSHMKYRAFRPLITQMLVMAGYPKEELRELDLKTLLKQKEIEGMIRKKVDAVIGPSYGKVLSKEVSRTQ